MTKGIRTLADFEREKNKTETALNFRAQVDEIQKRSRVVTDTDGAVRWDIALLLLDAESKRTIHRSHR